MNCHKVREHWSLYHDSEGDPELFLHINAHLAGCPSCAEWFERESRLENEISARLRVPEADSDVWSRVRVSLRTSPQPAGVKRWLPAAVAAVVAACMLALLAFQDWRESGSLSRESAAVHEALINGRTPVEFHSTSDLEVEAYLRDRVPFPVRCPPRGDSGFLVEGAGTTELADASAAYVIGRVQGRPVSLFILDRDSLSQFPAQREALTGPGMHHVREGRHQIMANEFDQNVVLVIGETDALSLERVIRAYGTYHEPDHG